MPKYIPLFPNPPNSPRQPQHDGPDDTQSDFPPCRIHESTPDPFTPPTNQRKSSRHHQKWCSSPSESEQSPRRLPRSQLPKTALGAKNVLNTIQVTVEQAKDVSKKSLKRRLEPVGIDRPSKRRFRHVYDDDMEWLKREIDDIKERMTQMDNKLEVILHEVQQFNEI